MRNKIRLTTLVILSIIAISLPAMAQAPSADFRADRTYGSAPLSVHFYSTNVEGNPTSYFWTFEPQTSSDWNSHNPKSAVHTFRHPGVYDVSLKVTNIEGSRTVTKEGYITVIE